MGFWTLDRKIGLSFLVALGLVLLYAVISLLRIQEMKEATSAREHTYQVLEQLDAAFSALKDAESSNRGYVITGDSIHLERFKASGDQIWKRIADVRMLVTDNREQIRRVGILDSLMHRRFESLQRTIMMRRDLGFETAQGEISTGRGRMVMDDVRMMVNSMKLIESNLLSYRIAAANKAQESSLWWLTMGTGWVCALIVFIGLSLILTLRKPLSDLILATRRIAGGDLSTPVVVRTRDELGDLGRSFNAMVTSLRTGAEAVEERERFFQVSNDLFCIADFNGHFLRLNSAWERVLGYSLQELEGAEFLKFVLDEDRPQTIAESSNLAQGGITINFQNRYRCADGSVKWLKWSCVSDLNRGLIYATARDVTGEIQQAEELQKAVKDLEEAQRRLVSLNTELQAFSYSVSHDLRAPLRAIDGFSEALLQDFLPQLDATAQDHLRRVRAATQRMGALIDDLLMLSQITRQEMRTEDVDLSSIASETLQRLQEKDPDRKVTLVIPDGIHIVADGRLLRIVMENLLGNAWKYTSKHSTARIEFGASRESGVLEYFVRDDGAGFDMQYASKLFAAFQRLHRSSEFEGTGIGLATVARIIHRHGGEVRACGEIEKGATFYFSLNQVPPNLGDQTNA